MTAQAKIDVVAALRAALAAGEAVSLESIPALISALEGGQAADGAGGADAAADGEIVVSDSNFTVVNRGDKLFLVTDDSYIGSALEFALRKMSDRFGEWRKAAKDSDGDDCVRWTVPLETLVKYLSSMQKWASDHDDDDASRCVARVYAAYSDFDPETRARVANGEVNYNALGNFFKKGDEVVVGSDRNRIAGEVTETNYVTSMWEGSYFLLTLRVLTAFTSPMGEAFVSTRVAAFDGWRDAASLPVRKLDDSAREGLSERGRRVAASAAAASYRRCRGNVIQRSWWGDKTYRADGRVMIDAATFKRVAADVYRDLQHASGINFNDNGRRRGIVDGAGGDAGAVNDERLHLCLPWLYGFSFAVKQWGEFHVDDISGIEFRKDAFDKLVLEDETKTLIRALIEHSSGGFADIIESKGGGTIFLLHGDPGVGKTLTAEAIAELLERPLYSVSVGELGTDPAALEKSLREILDVATIWNSVILLDEADIFLEARDEHNIERNAMVGVFLRLLEYHQGTLFLTTNRVRNFDKAFHSRISVAIYYPPMTADTRTRVWSNLLDAAGITGLDHASLAERRINARQIKTSIRLAHALAKSEGTAIADRHIDRVVTLADKFAEDVSDRR
jgi:hypothetical protein